MNPEPKHEKSMRACLLATVFIAALALGSRAEDGLSPDTMNRVAEATVLVEVWYREIGVEGAEIGPAVGTGFVVSEDGLVITNHHVVDSLYVYDPHENEPVDLATRAADRRLFRVSSIKVRLHSGTDRSLQLDAEVLATRDDPDDLALLRTHPTALLVAFPVADGIHDRSLIPEPQLTQKVWAVGYPLGYQVEDGLEHLNMKRNPKGLDLSVRDGAVSSLRKDEDGRIKVVEHTCAIDHGNSGGPLVDVKGRVVGVNTWGAGKVGYAIPIAAVLRSFCETLRLRGQTTVKREGASTRRILAVEPAGKEGGATFRSLEAALHEAQEGDEIALPEGEMTAEKEFLIPAGVRVRGAGVDRTVLRLADKVSVWIGGPGSCELSGLTIQSNSGGLIVAEGAGPETFVHDLKLAGGLQGVTLKAGACPSLVRIEFQGTVLPVRPDLVVNGASPRVERCDFGCVAIHGGTARLDGCVIRSNLVLSEKANVLVRGCSITQELAEKRLYNMPQTEACIRLKGSQGTFSFNRLYGDFTYVAFADPESTTKWLGNDIRNTIPNTRIVVLGTAEFEGNRIETGGDVAIEARKGATMTGNAVYFEGISERLATFLGAEAFEELKTHHIYAFLASGAEAHVSYGANRFHTWMNWGAPVGAEDDAALPEDLGKNETSAHASSADAHFKGR